MAIYTWGNVSSFDKSSGLICIKPSGVPYDKLKVEDMVVLSLDGVIVEGRYRPSSDTPTHLEIYKAFPNIGGICHTHSPYATAWSQSMLSLPLLGTTHADHSPLPVACTRLLREEEV